MAVYPTEINKTADDPVRSHFTPFANPERRVTPFARSRDGFGPSLQAQPPFQSAIIDTYTRMHACTRVEGSPRRTHYSHAVISRSHAAVLHDPIHHP